MQRWWGHRVQQTAHLDATDVARILGIDIHRVRVLLGRGQLAGERTAIAAGPNRRYRIQAADLIAFLEKYPGEYDPVRVKGEPYRTIAARTWARMRFVDTAEAARRLCMADVRGVSQLIRDGRLPGAVLSRGGGGKPVRYLIPEASLAQARIGDAAGTIRRRWEERTAELAREHGLRTVADVAAEYGISHGTMERWCHELGHPHIVVPCFGRRTVTLVKPIAEIRFSTPQVWQRGEREWPRKRRRGRSCADRRAA